MTSTRTEAAAAARIGAGLALRRRNELLALLRPCFARTGPWLQAGKYTAAVMSELAERNGWNIARHAGDKTPDKTQRLLNHASWDTFAAMGVVRRFAVAGLEEAARRGGRSRGLVIGAIDETGQEKAGEATAGVKRQYLGCAGRVANGINTVHLSYVRDKTGHALIGARQWIPREHLEDPVKSLLMGLPKGKAFDISAFDAKALLHNLNDGDYQRPLDEVRDLFWSAPRMPLLPGGDSDLQRAIFQALQAGTIRLVGADGLDRVVTRPGEIGVGQSSLCPAVTTGVTRGGVAGLRLGESQTRVHPHDQPHR